MAHIFSDLDVCDNAFFWNYDYSFIIEWGHFFRWCPLLRMCFSFLYGLLFFLHVLFFFYILYKAAHLFCTWSFDSSNTWCLFIRQDSKLILTIKFQLYPFLGFFSTGRTYAIFHTYQFSLFLTKRHIHFGTWTCVMMLLFKNHDDSFLVTWGLFFLRDLLFEGCVSFLCTCYSFFIRWCFSFIF